MNTKYILTARGKVKKLDLDNDTHRTYYYHYKDNPFLADYEQEDRIIDESDNLEDLLDEIVIDCKSNINKKPFIHILPPKVYVTKDRIDYVLTQDFEVYGAIWTHQGLIYVAKLNDKGELEIL